MVTIIAPLFEELQFRLPLSEKRKHFIFPILITLSFILIQILDNVSWLKFSIYSTYFIFLVFIFFRKERDFKNPKIDIFGTTIFFALLHSFNYELSELNGVEYLSILLAVLPQFIGGLMLAYIRIRFGFWYGVFFHGLWNFTLISLILILFSIVGDSLIY
ncbi:hypothetical protein GCM10026987_03580 [Belliella aquatica]|uniref:CAAX prenyl protease 2/Lysostaphin resistance protein A-like domain-containing protein n=1 Tax=Belliella aquatica TaxID=1323734 RepID=A0ABQ1M991_9BACT|nr:CPBP family glutamic-type intramembrane protease [Belliella aquatica]GGC36788.1 hypothetical protein GCM10010993_14520 [Belliella aquatica]